MTEASDNRFNLFCYKLNASDRGTSSLLKKRSTKYCYAKVEHKKKYPSFKIMDARNREAKTCQKPGSEV